MEMETCYKHGELLTKTCRQCEIEKFAEKMEGQGLCAICKDDIMDNSPTVKAIVHLSCVTSVFPAKKEPFKPNAWHKPPND